MCVIVVIQLYNLDLGTKLMTCNKLPLKNNITNNFHISKLCFVALALCRRIILHC